MSRQSLHGLLAPIAQMIQSCVRCATRMGFAERRLYRIRQSGCRCLLGGIEPFFVPPNLKTHPLAAIILFPVQIGLSHPLKLWSVGGKLLIGGAVLDGHLRSWDGSTWCVLTAGAVMLLLSCLTAYLLFKQTELRRAWSEQRQLSGMLIHARDLERRQLATELHDDFSQRLALLALGLETASEELSQSPAEADHLLNDLLSSARELGADLHSVCHRLHSSTLESLGLVAGVGAFCKDFGAQQAIRVEFTHENIPASIQPEVALGVFSVVQEALRNVKNHSHSADALVRLEMRDNAIHVSIRDHGIGFDLKKSSNEGRLGLRTIEERARFLGGRFEVHSEAQKGITIDAWIPLQPSRLRTLL
jgi:signal transduction histidine kinase